LLSSSSSSTTTTTTATLKPLQPESVLHRLVHSKAFSESEIVSELNHIHGAHKAVAFLTTCALVELTVNIEAREACITELSNLCGKPPYSLSERELIELAYTSSSSSSSSSTNSSSSEPYIRPPTRSDIENGRLPRTMNIMKETLRKHVVSMGVMRKLGFDEDAIIYVPDNQSSPLGSKSKALSSGSELLLLLHALHHDESLWGEDAHVWEPDRWDSQSDYWKRRREREEHKTSSSIDPTRNNSENDGFPASAPDAYFPFLDGSRRCAGMHLAQLEFVGMLYSLLVVYNVRAKLPVSDLASASVRAEELLSSEKEKALTNQDLVNEAIGIGGGVAIGKGRVIERPRKGSCIALIADKFAYKTNKVRVHLVKRPDYFTALDGNVEYELGRFNL